MGMVLVILLLIHPKTMAFIESRLKPGMGELTLVKELQLPHSSQIRYEKMEQYLVQYWDGVLYAYQGDGTQYWTLPIEIKQPRMVSGEQGLLLLDGEAHQLVRVNPQGELIYQVDLNQSVESFETSEQGHGLVYYTPGEGPLRILEIFGPEGETLGEITLNEGEVIKSSISGSSDRVFIYTLGIQQDGLVGQLQVFNLKGELIAVEKLPNEISLWMAMGKDHLLYMATDLALISFTPEGTIQWRKSLEAIHGVTEHGSGLLLVSFKGKPSGGIFQNKEGDKVMVFQRNGEITGEISFPEAITGTALWDKKILIYGNRSLYLYDPQGKQEISYSYPGDIEGAWMLSENQMAVITREKLSFYQVN